MTDKKPRGRPKVENAKTPTERKRASRAAQREAALPAYIAWVAAQLARCQSALANEARKNPRSKFIAVFTKRAVALEDLIRKLTAPVQPDEAARSAYLASVAASLARHQSALAAEVKADPQSRFVAVLTKRVAALMAVLSLPPQSSVTITPRRGRTG